MAATMGPKEAQLAEVWRDNRSYLVDLAFGMLGDVGAAEDAVQEAFARLTDSRFDEIEDKRGWLIVVTSRICLDQIHSARSRREHTLEASAIDLVGAPAPASVPPMDPADRVTLDDEVGLALLVVLQKLKPAERVAFVLHDVFQVPFETIANTLGRSAPTCRQLAKRARVKIGAHSTEVGADVSSTERRQVAEEFIQACSNGDMSALLQLLDPGVWGDVDLGPFDRRNGRGRRGPNRVAQNLLLYFGSSTTLVCNPIGGHPVVLSFSGDKLWAVIQLTVEDKLVKKVHVIADPAKIAFLNAQLVPAGSAGGTAQ
jgi:RNA polymerase sigma-70 factor, ECF subfamily